MIIKNITKVQKYAKQMVTSIKVPSGTVVVTHLFVKKY